MSEITVIKPKSNPFIINLGELWKYRELFFIFTWRDIKVRYKQTIVGIGWALFQPLITMIIFTVFFGRLAKIPSGNLPYSLFVLCGLVFWNFFSDSLTRASNSLIENEAIVKKIYFPRMILPFASVVTSFIDFSINLSILLIYALILGFRPSIWILLILPLSIIISSITSAGAGMFLASINAKYRDVRYVLPFFVQLMMFVSPIIYPTTIVRPENKFLLAFNPITGIVEATRVVVGGGSQIEWSILGLGAIMALICFLIGAYSFQVNQKYFADIV